MTPELTDVSSAFCFSVIVARMLAELWCCGICLLELYPPPVYLELYFFALNFTWVVHLDYG
jgi:hypothetical protein